MKTLIILLMLCGSCFASPILLQKDGQQTSIKIQLPSGLSVDPSGIQFCEEGCEDVVLNSDKKFMLLGLIGLVGLVALFDEDCCCPTPVTTTTPNNPGNPNTPTTPVSEPNTILLVGVVIYGAYARSKINKSI